MATIKIATNDPRTALAISEGANAVELKAVKARYAKLEALNGVRAYGDSVRFESVSKALAIKYSSKPVGRLRSAFLGVWALLWLGVLGWYEYLRDWNREV